MSTLGFLGVPSIGGGFWKTVYVSDGKVSPIWSQHKPGKFSGVPSRDASIPTPKSFCIRHVDRLYKYYDIVNFVLFVINLLLVINFIRIR